LAGFLRQETLPYLDSVSTGGKSAGRVEAPAPKRMVAVIRTCAYAALRHERAMVDRVSPNTGDAVNEGSFFFTAVESASTTAPEP
jgi:hypothetical protein